MKSFLSMGDFATHLLKSALAIYAGASVALEVSAKIIQARAKSYIGHLQKGAGPFAPWPKLSPWTIADKKKLGYGDENNDWQPLLREGDLRDSIEYEVFAYEAIVGSKSPIMAYQEFGTFEGARIPPRPVIGLAAYNSQQDIFITVGKAIMYGLSYGKPVNIEGYGITEINYV